MGYSWQPVNRNTTKITKSLLDQLYSVAQSTSVATGGHSHCPSNNSNCSDVQHRNNCPGNDAGFYVGYRDAFCDFVITRTVSTAPKPPDPPKPDPPKPSGRSGHDSSHGGRGSKGKCPTHKGYTPPFHGGKVNTGSCSSFR